MWCLRNSLISSAYAVFFCDLASHSLAWVLFWVSLYWFISDMMPVKQLHFHPYIIICSVSLWSCIPLSGFKLAYLNWDLFWVSLPWFLSDMRPVKQLQGHVFCCRLMYCLPSLLDCPSWRLARFAWWAAPAYCLFCRGAWAAADSWLLIWISWCSVCPVNQCSLTIVP